MFVFTPVSNYWIQSKMSKTFLIDFLVYEEIDVTTIKLFIPFCRIKNIDLSLPFKTFQDAKYQVKMCLAFDMVLGGYPYLNPSKYIAFKQILKRQETQQDVLNFYSIYFDIFQTTKDIYSSRSRDDVQILEQMTNNTINRLTLEIDENVDGYYDSFTKTLLIDVKSLNGIKLTTGTNVILNNQIREEENGKYIYTNNKLQKYLFGTSIEWTEMIDKVMITNGDIISIDDVLYIVKDKSLVPLPIEKEVGEYECYGDSTIRLKELCESPYDPSGKIMKTKITYWDKRCVTNDECPFYQANKNYKNYSGGCIDGHCQMPIGVKSLSFRQYDKSSKPLCYNCKQPNDYSCCDEQENPDYAFPLDNRIIHSSSKSGFSPT